MNVRSRGLALAASLLVLTPTIGAVADETDECVDAAQEGQRLRKARQLTLARPRLLRCSASTCPSVVSADCRRWLEELEQAMPSIIVLARDERDMDVPDAEVFVDGVERLEARKGHAFSVDPGPHEVLVRAPRRSTARTTLTAAEGERRRFVRLALAPERTRPPAVESSWMRSAGWWGLAGAGVGLTNAGVFGLMARSQYTVAENSCGGATPSCTEDDVSSGRTFARVSDISLIAALALAAVSTALVVIGGAPKAPR